MGMKLFDGGDSDNEDISKIEIDKEFARRYEHNKKREDLHRLQELQKQGRIPSEGGTSSSDDEESSSSDDESEDVDEIRADDMDLEFFNALIKVRNQDPSLKEKNVALFHSVSDDDDDKSGEGNAPPKEKKQKMYLKDVVAKHLIEQGPEFDDDDDGINTQPGAIGKKSYSEEQEELRRAFLQVADAVDDGEGGDFMKVKKKAEGDVGDGDGSKAAEFQKKLDEYFGREGNLDEDKMFLREYFLNKMWVAKDNKKKGFIDEDELDELLKDEEEIEKQEDYETNYRHEEDVGDRVLGHSRTVEGSVRKKEKARKKQRQSKEERIKIAEMERKEELKHLKNLKKEEIKEKLEKFKKIAGIGDDEECPLDADELDDEFDPEEYDRMMKAVFDDKYYEAEDVDPKFGSDREDDRDLEKPNFEKEDELLGLPKGWDGVGSSTGFSAARERSLKHKVDEDEDEDEDEEDEDATNGGDVSGDGENVSEDGKRKRKRKLSLVKRAKEAMMEEYYKLDYEDTIGDLKTRFNYAKIKPNRYGLSTGEILMMDDKELNQYVSLKKIAPYRDQEWKVHNSQRYQLKMKSKELQAKPGKHKSKKQKKRSRDEAEDDSGEALVDGSNADAGNLSKSAKRRRRQKELKLSNSRLVAYGKTNPKSKGKGKH